MLPFHRRLAEIGLAAFSEFGFVLAGGYAISANGMGDRPSEDVDMFTNRADPDQFDAAVDATRRAVILANFTGWADDIDPPQSGESGSGPAPVPSPRWETIEPALPTEPRRHPGHGDHLQHRFGVDR